MTDPTIPAPAAPVPSAAKKEDLLQHLSDAYHAVLDKVESIWEDDVQPEVTVIEADVQATVNAFGAQFLTDFGQAAWAAVKADVPVFQAEIAAGTFKFIDAVNKLATDIWHAELPILEGDAKEVISNALGLQVRTPAPAAPAAPAEGSGDAGAA